MSNDLFAQALTVTVGSGGTYTSPASTNSNPNYEAGEPATGAGSYSSWWMFQPTADGSITVDLAGSVDGGGSAASTNTGIDVFEGTTLAGLTRTAYNYPDTGEGRVSNVAVTGGRTYYLRATCWTDWDSVSYHLTMTLAPPPTIEVDLRLTGALAVTRPQAGAIDIDLWLGQPDELDAPAADAAVDADASPAESVAAPPADAALQAGGSLPDLVTPPPAAVRLTAPPPALRNTGGVGEPTPLGPTPMPTAMWYLVAYRCGQPDGFISELRSAKGIKFTASLDTATTPDQVDFSVNGNSEDMTILADPRGVDVVLMCNDDRVLRCRLLNNSGTAAGDGSHDVSFTAKGYTDWLGAFVLYDTDAAVDPGYTLVEAEKIGWDLIQVAQSRPYARLGITRGDDQATGILRTRTSYKQGDKVADLITKLGESNEVDDKTAGQFEWWIDPGLVYRVYPNGRGAHEPAFLIDSGGAARQFDYRADLSSSVNVVVAEGQDFARAIVESPDLATDPGGRSEMFVTADWVPAGDGNATIEGYARWVLLQHGNVPEVTVRLDTAHWITPADCWLGDFVALDLAEGYVAIRRDDLRVVEVQGEVADSGQAGITLTVGRKFPGIFQAIDQLVSNPPQPPANPLPKGSNGDVLLYDNGWTAGALGYSGVRVFVQPDEPAGANVGDLWYQTSG